LPTATGICGDALHRQAGDRFYLRVVVSRCLHRVRDERIGDEEIYRRSPIIIEVPKQSLSLTYQQVSQ
jgi:hypothetical protein